MSEIKVLIDDKLLKDFKKEPTNYSATKKVQ